MSDTNTQVTLVNGNKGMFNRIPSGSRIVVDEKLKDGYLAN